MIASSYFVFFFFFNDTATTEIYTLSLHDALPISGSRLGCIFIAAAWFFSRPPFGDTLDRKSTRLNSSHANISYAVFCLKKKKQRKTMPYLQPYSSINSSTW